MEDIGRALLYTGRIVSNDIGIYMAENCACLLGACEIADNTGDGVYIHSGGRDGYGLTLISMYAAAIRNNGGNGLSVDVTSFSAPEIDIFGGEISGNKGCGILMGLNSGSCTIGPSEPYYEYELEFFRETLHLDDAPAAPAKGDSVTVTVTPEEGYVLDTLTVTDSKGNIIEVTKQPDGTFRFTQPAGKITVTATFKAEAPAAGLTVAELLEMFGDLDPEGWYLECVRYCVEQGIMNGMDDGAFGPGLQASRTMVVQLLWNLAGRPEPVNPAPFDDVDADAWYAKAVAWAYENGITSGTGIGFEPGADITREQLAVMLYNFAKLRGLGFEGLWSFPLDFPDAADVSSWAREAVSWLVMNGIINGTVDEEGAILLDPQGDATRAQLAAMIERFCKNVLGKQ